MRLSWTRRARVDLREITAYLAKDNPDAAERMEKRIREATRFLPTHPEMGRLGRVSGTRELVVTGTRYIVPYRIRGELVELLAVVHTSRQWPTSFD